MDYITRLYRSKAEQLQEQVNFLEAQLQQLAENSPPASTFSGTGQGQQTFNDEQLKYQMRQFKKSGFFGAEVGDDKQSSLCCRVPWCRAFQFDTLELGWLFP